MKNIFLLKINSHSHIQHNGHGKNIGMYFIHFCHFAPTVLKNFYRFNFGGIKVLKRVKITPFQHTQRKLFFTFFPRKVVKISFFEKKCNFTFFKKLIDLSGKIWNDMYKGECLPSVMRLKLLSFKKQIFIIFNAKLYKRF